MGMVIVFGSLNMDLVTRTPRLPEAGETLIGAQFYMAGGGKGANQAVAVAKLGVATEMVGRVGGDQFGADLLSGLRSAGVGTQHVQVILDPAPVPPEPLTDLYPLVDLVLPNQVEATQLVGFTVHDRETATQAARVLQTQGVHTVIVKLGAQGALCATPEEDFFIPTFPVAAIDTVAAGDAFAGGLVAALVEGLPLRQATKWAAAAGALATTRVGAQSAMPDRAELQTFLADQVYHNWEIGKEG